MYKCFIIFTTALSAAAFAVSPLCRDFATETYDRGACLLTSLGKGDEIPVAPEVAELAHAESTLQADRESLSTQRIVIREQIRLAKEKLSDYKRLMEIAEENAIHFRDILTKAQMSNNDAIIIYGRVFSQNELSTQIETLQKEHDSLRMSIETYPELLDKAVKCEQELMVTLSSVNRMLDQIPLQRVLMLSKNATERTAETIADVKNIHQKVQSIQRVEKLMTAEEIEEQRIAATPEKPGDTERLQDFLSGKDIFALEK